MPDTLWQSNFDAIPVEADLAVAPPGIERRGIYHGPLGIVEASGACMGRVIVGPHGSSRGIKVRPRAFRIDLDDSCVVVTPFALYNLRSFPRAEINRCVWTPIGRSLSGPVLGRERLDPKK